MGEIIFAWLLGFATSLFIFAVWAADLKADKDNYQIKYEECDISYRALVDEYNRLVRKSNALKDLCDELESNKYSSNISSNDIKKLLSLCHPDKHGGKTIAHEMTQKLLDMRKFA